MIDAHQHFWNPGRGDYHWMPLDNPVLARTYAPADLAAERERFGITHTVVVQAAATVNETEYMLGVADATDSVAAVVGWIDFENRAEIETLARLSGHRKFRGVRPMIQDIPDPNWMLREDVQWAFEAIADLDMTFDALGFPVHLENFLTILTRYPQMRAVVDHCMKPEIRNHDQGPEVFESWAAGLSAIAEKTSAYCKLSGLVTEASEDWSVEDLRPYAAHVLKAFGPERIMWGSDWPVCRLRGEYADWRLAAEALTDPLSPGEKERVFSGTAIEFYTLEV